MRRQRTLCGIRIKSFGTLFVSAPLCGDSDLCDPDRNQSAVVGCFERTPLCEDCDLCDQKQITANIAALRVLYHVWYGIAATEGRLQTTQPLQLDVWVLSSIFDENNERDFKKNEPVLTIIYRPIAYEHRPTRGRSTAVEPVIQAPAVPHV